MIITAMMEMTALLENPENSSSIETMGSIHGTMVVMPRITMMSSAATSTRTTANANRYTVKASNSRTKIISAFRGNGIDHRWTRG